MLKTSQAVGNPGIELEAIAQSLETQAHNLVEQARALRARGTRELPVQVESAPVVEPAPAPPEPGLLERVTAALRTTPLSIEELAAQLRTPVGRISKELKSLRKQLWNAGTDTAPRWFLAPPANATPEQFTAAVQALIRLQPHSTAELQTATHTNGSKKVWHAIVKLVDMPGSRLVRIGDTSRPRKIRWFWVPESADLARFTPPTETGSPGSSLGQGRSVRSRARGGSA